MSESRRLSIATRGHRGGEGGVTEKCGSVAFAITTIIAVAGYATHLNSASTNTAIAITSSGYIGLPVVSPATIVIEVSGDQPGFARLDCPILISVSGQVAIPPGNDLFESQEGDHFESLVPLSSVDSEESDYFESTQYAGFSSKG